MKTDSDRYEAPVNENTEVLGRGFAGGLTGASVFSILAAFYATAIVGIRGEGLAVVVATFLGVFLLLVLYYAIIGMVCFLVGLGFSRLIGHRLDLRLVATLTACCTAYLPAVLVLNTPGGRQIPIEYAIEVGLWFSIPMSFAAIGAWVAADREFHELKVESVRSGQFDLKILFSVTLILAVLMFLVTLLKLDAGFFIGFLVALVPTSISTALVAWVRAIGRMPTTARD